LVVGDAEGPETAPPRFGNVRGNTHLDRHRMQCAEDLFMLPPICPDADPFRSLLHHVEIRTQLTEWPPSCAQANGQTIKTLYGPLSPFQNATTLLIIHPNIMGSTTGARFPAGQRITLMLQGNHRLHLNGVISRLYQLLILIPHPTHLNISISVQRRS
jgi:hypothetical protein